MEVPNFSRKKTVNSGRISIDLDLVTLEISIVVIEIGFVVVQVFFSHFFSDFVWTEELDWH